MVATGGRALGWLRMATYVSALLIITGEGYRSWGSGAPLPFVLDDLLTGGLLLAAAWGCRRPSATARRFLSASWGLAVWMLYGSFFGKFFEDGRSAPPEGAAAVVAALVGVSLLVGVICFVASILIPDEQEGQHA